MSKLLMLLKKKLSKNKTLKWNPSKYNNEKVYKKQIPV